MSQYQPLEIEAKWQEIWAKTRLYEVGEDSGRPKTYATPMLPYPSGTGLHVGHVRNYSISDAVARWKRQQGHAVLNAIGWDSFGLPAENYAIKTGTPPRETTEKNIENFKRQLQRLGISIDWSREINTSDPDYYRWTQWIFLQLFNAGLAYQATSAQWWCPRCKTVLANEQVVNGCCWRHDDTPVVKKSLKQWFFKITDYVDRLLEDLDDLNWPESIKTMQRNWIGRSEGAELTFRVKSKTKLPGIKVFTTRPDTIFGATFMVLAPEHKLVKRITTTKQAAAVEKYVEQAVQRTDVERMNEDREKTGVFTGAYAINPANQQAIPIWIADYVLAGYGTGAIMAVPAHDARDWEFARRHKLNIVPVFSTPDAPPPEEGWIDGEGKMINSGAYDGMDTSTARERIVEELDQAKAKVNYKMRDWLISRQRYWGAPIPIIHCADCGAVPVPESELPVELPPLDKFEPTGSGKSVLASVDEWVNVECPHCGGAAKRETDTMDGYACSSWYMHRYTDARNPDAAWDPGKVNYWFPVDFYFGGDHAVSHLLYFRFWHKFFTDQGLIDRHISEPVKTLVFNGYINAADGSKMSKSKGNVVDPLEVIDSGYGADALRMFELFIGPYDQDVQWNPNGVPGTYRFLQRVWVLAESYLNAVDNLDAASQTGGEAAEETRLLRALHRTIKKVTTDLEHFRFNTAVAALMEFVNTANDLKSQLPFTASPRVWKTVLEDLTALVAPFAPHLSEELWSRFGHSESVHVDTWPMWQEEYIASELKTIVVQVNGKLRANLELASDADMGEAVRIAKAEPNVAKHLKSGRLVKTVTVPDKLVNFVVK